MKIMRIYSDSNGDSLFEDIEIALFDSGVEIEMSLGEVRQFQTGEIPLVEDTTTKGHRTRNL